MKTFVDPADKLILYNFNHQLSSFNQAPNNGFKMMSNPMIYADQQQHHSPNNNASPQSIADYLAQLLKDRKQLAAFPNVFVHVERLLDEGELRPHGAF